MERLFYIKFYDKDNSEFVAREDYSGLQFANSNTVEKYIQSEKKLMEVALDCKLKLTPYHKEIPNFSIKDLINSYCETTGYTYAQIVGKGRHRDYVNVRMFITKTALDLGFVHGQLRPYFDVVSYHYEKTFMALLESGSMTIQLWKSYEERVMRMLGEICADDGSGESITK